MHSDERCPGLPTGAPRVLMNRSGDRHDVGTVRTALFVATGCAGVLLAAAFTWGTIDSNVMLQNIAGSLLLVDLLGIGALSSQLLR